MDPISKILFAERIRLSNALRREIASLKLVKKDIMESIEKSDPRGVHVMDHVVVQVDRLDIVLSGLNALAKAQNVLISQTPEARFVKSDLSKSKPDDKK